MYQVGPTIILNNLSNSLSCNFLKSVVITLAKETFVKKVTQFSHASHWAKNSQAQPRIVCSDRCLTLTLYES